MHLQRRVCVRLLCCALVLLARQAGWAAAHWGLERWSTENGLPQNSVHQVLEARDGFLWIATEGGVARFDGAEFRVFDQHDEPALTTNDACCVAQSADGALWIGTADGLLREQGGRFTRIDAQNGLPSSAILTVAPLRRDGVAVLTAGGLVRVDGRGHVHTLSGPVAQGASAVTAGADGSLWAAWRGALYRSRNDGLSWEQTGTLQNPSGRSHAGQVHGRALGEPQEGGPGAYSPDEPVLGLQVTAAGAVWWWTSSEVVERQGAGIHSWRVGSALPDSRVNAVMVDREGRAWVAGNRGLVWLGPRGQVHPLALLGQTPVLTSFEDREGNLWVGTENSGLAILRPQEFAQLAGLEDRVITSIVQGTGGSAFVGTRDDGLWRAAGGRPARQVAARGLASQVILSLAPGLHGDVWVGTPDGLSHLDAGRVTTYTSVDGLPDDFIRSLLVDPDGSVWVGTRRGLAHWTRGQQAGAAGSAHVATWTSADGLASDLVGALRRSGSDLWVATLSGVSRLRGGRLTTFTAAEGVPGRIVTSLAMTPDGTVWAGARDGGLAFFREGRFVRCGEPGLPSAIDSLLVDARGYLWMGTRAGLVRAAWAPLEACGGRTRCRVSTARFGVLDGMPSEEASTIGHPAAWRMQDGSLWFATRKGVATVDPEHLRLDTSAVPVVIETFAVDGVPQPEQRPDVRIRPGHASFTFHYAGLSYRAPSHVEYRYMLEGFDHQWTFAGDRRTAYYTNLPPRHYVFRVQAARGDGAWSGPGATLSFAVLPPFYRRWWFYLVVVVCLGAVVYLWHALRVRRLEAAFRAVLGERTRIAREIHDTLAQDFVGVSLQLEMAAQLLANHEAEAARSQLDETRQLVRQGLKDARESIWQLRATAAEGTLPARLARLAERSRGEPVIRVKVSGAYRLLPAKLENELLRIAQEAVTNVVRHAHAQTALVALDYAASHVTLRVEDDGRGFDPAAVGADHYGLQGIRERAAAVGAELRLESAPGDGTRLSVTAPAA